MRGEQLFLFPELDPFKTLIKNVDYVDLSTLTLGDENRKNLLSNLPKGMYFIYKTGGCNQYLPKLGRVFPYIKNEKTGKILNVSVNKTYIRCTINQYEGTKDHISYNLHLHRMACEAFVINDNPAKKKIVDHKNDNRLDYRVSNLRWVTYSQNKMGTSATWGKTYEDKLYQNALDFSWNKSPKM